MWCLVTAITVLLWRGFLWSKTSKSGLPRAPGRQPPNTAVSSNTSFPASVQLRALCSRVRQLWAPHLAGSHPVRRLPAASLQAGCSPEIVLFGLHCLFLLNLSQHLKTKKFLMKSWISGLKLEVLAILCLLFPSGTQPPLSTGQSS